MLSTKCGPAIMDAFHKVWACYDGWFSVDGFQYIWVAAMSVGL